MDELKYLVDRMLEEAPHNYFAYKKLRDKFDAKLDELQKQIGELARLCGEKVLEELKDINADN